MKLRIKICACFLLFLSFLSLFSCNTFNYTPEIYNPHGAKYFIKPPLVIVINDHRQNKQNSQEVLEILKESLLKTYGNSIKIDVNNFNQQYQRVLSINIVRLGSYYDIDSVSLETVIDTFKRASVNSNEEWSDIVKLSFDKQNLFPQSLSSRKKTIGSTWFDLVIQDSSSEETIEITFPIVAEIPDSDQQDFNYRKPAEESWKIASKNLFSVIDAVILHLSGHDVFQDISSSKSMDSIPIVTVLDIQSRDISKSEVTLITDMLASSLLETRRVRLIDRKRRSSILEEIEFSYSDCVDESCQIEIGKLLSADKIVVGILGYIEGIYVLNTKIIDVATGETLTSSTRKFSSRFSIADGLDQVAKDLVGE